MPCYAIEGVIPIVDPTAYVHPTAVLIGDVVVGPDAYIGPCASLRGDFGRIVLGRGVNIQDSCVVHGFPNRETVVEDNGHIGHGAILHGCVVRHDALVGMNAVVMDDAEVGEQAVVAACSFVPIGMKLPPRTLAAGAPAKVRRALDADEITRKLEGTLAYQMLARRCHASLREVAPLAAAPAERPRVLMDDVRRLTDPDRGSRS